VEPAGRRLVEGQTSLRADEVIE